MATDVRRGVLVGAALVVGLIVGLLIGLSIGPESEVEAPQAKPDSDTPGPTDVLNGVPVGYARTEEGAVRAAANFTLLTADDSLFEQEALASAMESLAAPAWKQEARRQAIRGHQFIIDRYGSDAKIAAAVLRYDIAEFHPERAVVNLWGVSIISGPKRPTVDEVWATLTVDLLWTDGDWRVAGSESTPGPAPVELPSGQPEQSISDLVNQFEEFDAARVP